MGLIHTLDIEDRVLSNEKNRKKRKDRRPNRISLAERDYVSTKYQSKHNPMLKGLVGSTYSMTNSDIEKWKTTYDIVNDVIDNVDSYGLAMMYSSYEKDLDITLNKIIHQVHRILFGKGDTLIDPTFHYMREIDGTIKEQMRLNDITFFASDVLGMQINWHHVEWGWLVRNFLLIAILAARDHGKSYFWSNAYPLWMAYKYDKSSIHQDRLNGRSGYLFSNTASQAADLLEILKDNVESTDLLRERLYPNFRDTWSKTSIKFKNGCRLRAKGFGSSVRGAHPGYIVVDDPMKDNVLYSPVQRDRGKQYFNSVILNMLIPGGQCAVVGTPFHRDDMYSLYENGIDFAFRKYPALDKSGKCLWPERHSHEDLMMRKRVQGSVIFSREFLCQPISTDSSLFPERILQRALVGMEGYSYVHNIQEHPLKFSRIVTGADFAYSSTVGADYTSFATIGIDDKGNRWLLHLYREKGVGYSEQKRVLRSIWRNFKPDLMLLESNQFQKIFAETLADETEMPVRPFLTTKKKHHLEEGVPGLVILFENGKFKFPYATKKDKAITELVLDEFRHVGWTEKGIMGIGSHDDIAMSIYIANEAAKSQLEDFVMDFA